MRNALEPTLWRTCRVLTHPVRLQCLRVLMKQGPMTVSGVAAACAKGTPAISQHLRQLQARGLLAVRREGRCTVYSLSPDPAVGHAADVLAAVTQALKRGAADSAIRRAMTAFTHPRRIAILLALDGGTASAEHLCAACGVSRPAVHRHLRKLIRREVVEEADSGYRITRATDSLSAALRCIVTTPPSHTS
jgi:DNA-binding transcriptional ArsR family regulator